MAFVKKALAGATAPVKAIKSNPWALIGILLVVLGAIRYRSQIMAGLSKLGPIGTGANKLAGEG